MAKYDMQNYQYQMFAGQASKQVMSNIIKQMLNETRGRVFDQGDPTHAYQMGVHFGTQDALLRTLEMLESCPDVPPPEPKAWHHK